MCVLGTVEQPDAAEGRYSSIDGENTGQIDRSLLLITVRYCSKEMKEEDRVITSGPFKGKKIRFAPTNGVNMFVEISEEFMRKIFDFEPGEYLITDESSLYDFTGLDEMELTDIQKKIQDVYDLDVSDAPERCSACAPHRQVSHSLGVKNWKCNGKENSL